MDDINTRLAKAMGQPVMVGIYDPIHGILSPKGNLAQFDNIHITISHGSYVRTYVRSSLIYIQIEGEIAPRPQIQGE